METAAQPRKRPVGMTILLVMSFINACWNILTGMVSFLVLPGIASTYESGQMEETMGPFYGAMSDEMKQMMMDGVRIFSQIDPKYCQYSCLENSNEQTSWWATAHGVTKSWTQLSD